jgi:hypothetical protein
MSLIGSLLSLVLIPLKAKPRNLAAERPKEVDNLAVMALADEVRRLNFALDHWRDAGLKTWEENQRLRQELRGVRDDRDLVRAELRELMVQKDPTSPYYRHSGFEARLNRLNATMLQTRDSPHPYCIPSRGQALNRDQAE